MRWVLFANTAATRSTMTRTAKIWAAQTPRVANETGANTKGEKNEIGGVNTKGGK